jgi:hypothetical protein
MEALRQAGTHAQQRTVARVLAWAAEAAPADPGAQTHHRLLRDQIELLAPLEAQIGHYERDLADHLVETPFVLLLGIPAINVVSAASYGAELGPIEHYLHHTKITGRAGIYPSRYQSDETDLPDGPLVGQRNARLRDAIFEIAHNLISHNLYFHAWADVREKRQWPSRKIHVAVACKFVRISYSMLAGRCVFQHPCTLGRDAILRKLFRFAQDQHLAPEEARSLLLRALRQLPGTARAEEARALLAELPKGIRRRRRSGPEPLSTILPEVIAQLDPGSATATARSTSGPPQPVEDPAPRAGALRTQRTPPLVLGQTLKRVWRSLSGRQRLIAGVGPSPHSYQCGALTRGNERDQSPARHTPLGSVENTHPVGTEKLRTQKPP